MQYKIVTAEKRSELSKEVNDLLSQGWKPQGGVSLARWAIQSDSGTWIESREYAQAMVKEE